MSDQSQTTANAPADPVLCKMGCGFFGNSATGGCCSKCWRDHQKKEDSDTVACVPATKKEQPETTVAPSETPEVPSIDSKSSSQEVKADGAKLVPEESPVAPKKKKGKKKSYKAMMAGMMSTQANSEKAEKEKEALRKVTGGGAFSKVEKI